MLESKQITFFLLCENVGTLQRLSTVSPESGFLNTVCTLSIRTPQLLPYLFGMVGWCEGVVYLTSPGRPTDIGLQFGKTCYTCSR